MGENVHFIILIISALIIFTSLNFLRIQKSFISEPLLVMLIGLGLQLSGISSFQIENKFEIMEFFSRVTIIVVLISSALRIRHTFIMEQKRNLTIIVFTGMLGMWIVSSLIFYFLFAKDILFSLLAGAILTPTDPVVSSSVISGKTAKKLLPENVRNSISFESGSNDGLAFPIVMLPFLLITHSNSTALRDFFLKIIFWENVVAILLAGILGYSLGRIYHNYHRKQLMSQKAIIGFSITFTFFIYSLFELIQANSIISVFVAGIMFNLVVSKNEAIREELVQEVMERMLVVPIFFLLGFIAPYSEWIQMGLGKLIILVIALILFRRLPVFIGMKIFLRGYKMRDILFIGWFGPIGVAAIFYSMYINRIHYFSDLWPIISFVIFGFTLIHGVTRYYIALWYNAN